MHYPLVATLFTFLTFLPSIIAPIPNLPTSAVSCIQNAVTQVGCTDGDTACECSPTTENAISSDASFCIAIDCSEGDALVAQSAALAYCASYTSSIAHASTATANNVTPTSGVSAGTTPIDTPTPSVAVTTQSSSVLSLSQGGGSFTTHSSTVPLVTPGGSSVTPTFAATTSSTPEVSQSTSSSDLSTGAKAGIAVGAVVGFALLVAAGFLIYRQGQRSSANGNNTKTSANPDAGEHGAGEPGMAELGGNKTRPFTAVTAVAQSEEEQKIKAELVNTERQRQAELDNNQSIPRHEMNIPVSTGQFSPSSPRNMGAAELDGYGRTRAAELEAQWAGHSTNYSR